MDTIRLNKYLAHHLGISRREADDYISSGRVTVNGEVAILGKTIGPAQDTVVVNGKPIGGQQAPNYLYIALNKPVGYVCSRRQQGDNPTIYSILPKEYQHLKPVGRLDKNSSGLLLLTNDGDFAHRMTHPSFQKVKRYEVSLNMLLEPKDMQKINEVGVELEDGLSKFSVSKADREFRITNYESSPSRRYIVEMAEGRNRQIRRTFAALGYTVTRLHRTQFGPYSLHNLAEGKFQEVSKK